MKLRKFGLVAFLFFAVSPIALAEIEVPLVDISGNDSGWSAFLANDTDNGIVVDEIGDTRVLIQIVKNFRRPLTPNVIRFEQRLDDGLTLGTIDLADEVIYNNTGVDWTGYHWEISECVAAFNATDSSGFDVSPFTNKTWGPQQCGNWQADQVASLTVDGGTVPAGGTFTPGLDQGKLSINVDLSGTGPVEFTLTQFPIPEPAALTTVTIGFLGVLLRRRRRP